MNTHLLDKQHPHHSPLPFVAHCFIVRRRCLILSFVLFCTPLGCIEDPAGPLSDPDPITEVSPDRSLTSSLDLGDSDLERSDENDVSVFDLGETSDLTIADDHDMEIAIDMATSSLDQGEDTLLDWSELLLPLPEINDERCDGEDNDLDGLTDEGVSNPCGGCEEFDENVGCVAWRAQLVETQELNSLGEMSAGTLNPQRLLSLSASVKRYERFNMGESECIRYGAPQNWIGARSIGEASLDTPNASLTLVPDPTLLGRYRALSVDDTPFVIHHPGERVNLSWNGQLDQARNDGPIPLIEPGQLSLSSPSFIELATPRELERLIDVIQAERGENEDDEALAIRWVATPNDRGLAGDPLTLYIGGSQSLFREGAYQGIRHYQLNGRLFDDGRIDLSIPPRLSAPNSSVWVYLERSVQDREQSGMNPVVLNVGHRVESRRSGGGTRSPARLTLLSPSPTEPEPNPMQDGLRVSWSMPDEVPESVQVGLILYDSIWSESLSCVVSGDALSRDEATLHIPPELINFWPTGIQSVRQLTVSATFKSLNLTYPDTGQWRLTESLILRLSDL